MIEPLQFMSPDSALLLAEDDNDEERSLVPARASPDTTIQPEHNMRLWKKWNLIIHACYPIVLLMMVFVLWPWGYSAFRDLLPKTDSTFHTPVPGSPSDDAQQAIARKFPFVQANAHNNHNNHYNHPALLVVLHSNSNHSLVDDSYARDSSLQLAPFLNQQLRGLNTTTTTTAYTTGDMVQVSSYYSYRRENLHLLAQPFLSYNEQTTFLQIVVVPNPEKDKDPFYPKRVLGAVMHALDEYYFNETTRHPSVQVGMTGLDYFSRDLRTSTQADLKRMHLHVLPAALFLVARTLMYHTTPTGGGRSQQPFWKRICNCGGWNWNPCRKLTALMIIPICALLSTVATWSWILNTLILPHMQVTQFTPSIMMSLTLAMGMDYTLFLVARFLTELPSSDIPSRQDAMEIMLTQAGQVVVVSGMTLICTFLGLVALPLSMLQSIGVGAALAISSAMLMNLLIIPSLLYTPWMQNWLTDSEVAHRETTLESPQLSEPLIVDNEPVPGESPRIPLISEEDSIWMWLARQVIHPYKSIIIVLVILQILLFPVAWNSRNLDSSDISFSSLLPRDAPSMEVYETLIGNGGFSPGKLAPFRILLDGTKSNSTMDTSQAFAMQHDLVSILTSVTVPGNNRSALVNFAGISVAKQSPIPYSVYEASKVCAMTNCSNDALRCLHAVEQELLSPDRLATIIMAELESVSPFDKTGIAWLDKTRKQIHLWEEQNPGVDVYVDGVSAVAHDAVTAAYSSFAQVIGIAMAVVFGLLGLVFRSIVPPLRSIISITFTLTVSFGMAVLVYQDGFFASLHIGSLTAVDLELSWLVPVMSFSIIVGLALDYDIFLITRVSELRFLQGYSHESSIAAGLNGTGRIITSAGLIMAVSFGSLQASQSPALNQWAFVVTFSVLLDTFVVRTILVPAMMAWTGEKYSWYPRRLPTPTVTLSGFDAQRSIE